jgi:hypothetical protein
MGKLDEIFVAIKEIDYIEAQINDIRRDRKVKNEK